MSLDTISNEGDAGKSNRVDEELAARFGGRVILPAAVRALAGRSLAGYADGNYVTVVVGPDMPDAGRLFGLFSKAVAGQMTDAIHGENFLAVMSRAKFIEVFGALKPVH